MEKTNQRLVKIETKKRFIKIKQILILLKGERKRVKTAWLTSSLLLFALALKNLDSGLR